MRQHARTQHEGTRFQAGRTGRPDRPARSGKILQQPRPARALALVGYPHTERGNALAVGAIGAPVELTFRKLFTADGIHNYFWKARIV